MASSDPEFMSVELDRESKPTAEPVDKFMVLIQSLIKKNLISPDINHHPRTMQALVDGWNARYPDKWIKMERE